MTVVSTPFNMKSWRALRSICHHLYHQNGVLPVLEQTPPPQPSTDAAIGLGQQTLCALHNQVSEKSNASHLIPLKNGIFHFTFVQVYTGSYNRK